MAKAAREQEMQGRVRASSVRLCGVGWGKRDRQTEEVWEPLLEMNEYVDCRMHHLHSLDSVHSRIIC